MMMTRRAVATLVAATAMATLPNLSRAQARRFAVASITGSWEVAFREIIIPAFRAHNGNPDVALDAIIALEQLAKVAASPGNPPLDTMLLDSGPALMAIDKGLVDPLPIDQLTNYKDISPAAKLPDGVAAFFIFIGIAYNPDRIKTPPASWADLWKPEYKGRVGVTTLASTLGVAFLVEAARMHGGSETDIEPGFKALEALKPNLASVAANPSQAAILFEQGQIDIAPAVFNEIELLKARDVPVAFTLPKERGIGYTSSFFITKGSQYRDLAAKFIDTALSADVQTKMMQPPFEVTPTNTKVTPTGAVAAAVGTDIGAIKDKLVFQDWAAINRNRAAWIDRFNREMRF
jgi:putative spermidine/putrescine transport system substrate-binding protein